jgi:hypothetical protein
VLNAVLKYRPTSETPAKREGEQTPLTFFLVVLFVLLRFLAGGRGIAEQETNLSVVLLGLGILTGLILVNRPIALVLIVFDIVDMAGWISPWAWGIPGAFKFKDAEFVLLMAMGIIGLVMNPHLRRHIKTALSRAMTVFAVVVGIYILYTLTFQGLSITFRVARCLIYYSLFFVTSFYIRSERELHIALRGFFVLMLASSITHILQALIFPIHTLLPYTPSAELAGGFVRMWGPSQPFNFIGVLVFFGYLLQTKKFTVLTVLALGICLLSTVLTLARVYTILVIIGLFIVVLLLSAKRLRLRNAARFAVILIISLSSVWLLLSATGKGNLVSEVVSSRVDEAQRQFRVGSGTFFIHVDYVAYVSDFVEQHEGNAVFGLGYRAFFSDDFAGAPITGWDESSAISIFLADNGWAGLAASMGLVGIALLFLLVVQGCRGGWYLSSISKNMINRSLGVSLVALFSLTPIYLFVSSWIFSADAAIVTALAMGLADITIQSEVKERA